MLVQRQRVGAPCQHSDAAREGANSLPEGRLASTKRKPYAHRAGRPCARSPLPLIPRSRRAPARRPDEQLDPHTPVRPSPTNPGRAERLHRRPDQQSYPHTRQSHLVLPNQTTQRPPPLISSSRSAFKRKQSTSRRPAPAIPPALESLTSHPPYASRQGIFLA